MTRISVSELSSTDINVAKYCELTTKDKVGPLVDLVSFPLSRVLLSWRF